MIVVFDTNVVVSAAFWAGSDDRRCFTLVAKRKCRLATTEEILAEYRELAERIRQKKFPQKNPKPLLDWIALKSLIVEPVSLGKQRSRDAEDDPFLACALASEAKIIVSKDLDLLELHKPFGIDWMG